jgi:hypothetical protein
LLRRGARGRREKGAYGEGEQGTHLRGSRGGARDALR